jgi:hypothetical protein
MPRPGPETPGYIYFIADERMRVKIGWTVDVTRRFCTLQVGNADELALLAVITGTPDDEQRAHLCFGARERGEWFWPTEGLVLALFDLGADVLEPSRKGRWKEQARRRYQWLIDRKNSVRDQQMGIAKLAFSRVR